MSLTVNKLDNDDHKYILNPEGVVMVNPDLKFQPREDIDVVEAFVELAFVCDIAPDGCICINNVFLNIDDLEAITTKAKEIRKFGKNPPTCESCGGTPFFPNERPACPQWDKHICLNHIHTQQV